MSASPYRRIVRRETHSPRSALAITIAAAGIGLLAWIGTESVLRMLGQAPLLSAPGDTASAVAGADSLPPGILTAGGVVTALIGLLLLITAFTPGRRAKHSFTTDRSAVVMDDEIIASSLARRAAHAARVSPDNARVTLSRRRASVVLRPSSGFAVDRDAVQQASDDELRHIAAVPAISPRVLVAADGKVGS